MYPALLPLMRTSRLPVVDWTDAPADLNGLVLFAERRKLVSARKPSHFKRSLLASITEIKGKDFVWPLNPHSVWKHVSTKAAHNITSRNYMPNHLTVTPSKLVLRSAFKNNSSHTGSRYRKSATVWFSRTWRMCRATCWMASATAQIPSYVYPWNREYSGPRRESYSSRYSSAVCNR